MLAHKYIVKVFILFCMIQTWTRSLCGVVVNVLDCDIVVSAFELQSGY